MTQKRPYLSIICLILVLLMAGCGSKAAGPVGEEALQALLTQVKFDTELKDNGDSGALFFPGLPSGSQVKVYSGSAYFADEVVLITLASADDITKAKPIVDNHLQELHNQFMNYVPEELDKIDNAVVQENDRYVILCITNDYKNAKAVLNGEKVSENAQTQGTSSAAEAQTVPDSTGKPMESTAAESTAPAATVPETTIPETTVPETYPVLTSPSGTYHDYGNNTIRVDNGSFELYGYLHGPAKTYVGLVNQVADELAGQVNVYSLAIPTAIGVVLPDNVAEILPSYTDQNAAIEDIYSQMSSNVIPVRCHHNMMLHRDEYLYFHTDYHWNGPGAFYAYESFCETKGVKAIPMEERTEKKFDGFIGALYSQTSGEDPILKKNPDTVYAYCPKSQSVKMTLTESSGKSYDWNVVADVSGWAPGTKYNAFGGGDNPFTEYHNSEVTDGSVCVVIKESYGNALMPYLVDHYSTIYEIDYRYWDGNLQTFAKEKGATDILFANNLSMIGSNFLIGKLSNIIK